MTNFQKRILTSLFIFPLSIFFIVKGGNYIVSFLYAVLILGNFEAFSTFKRKTTIIFLDVILVISLLSLLFLRNESASSYLLLIWIIILTIFSDIGGYVFGKVFRWRKLTSISPNKTLSGVIGSFFFSILSVINKTSAAVSGAFVLLFLYWVDFDPMGNNKEDTLFYLTCLYALAPIILKILPLFTMWSFKEEKN